MTTALLSLGSNLGEPYGQLMAAHQYFQPWLLAESSIYRTSPWGVTDQPDFLNSCLLVRDPQYRPEEWLRQARRIEQEAHRERTQRWGPRTLDVDIIACWGNVTRKQIRRNTPVLTLPHPRAQQRAFVLIPAIEVLTKVDPRHPLIAQYQAALRKLPPEEVAGVIQLDKPGEGN